MKVKIRTKDIRFSMPVPVAMLRFIIMLTPQRVFQKMSEDIPKPYCYLVTKKISV